MINRPRWYLPNDDDSRLFVDVQRFVSHRISLWAPSKPFKAMTVTRVICEADFNENYVALRYSSLACNLLSGNLKDVSLFYLQNTVVFIYDLFTIFTVVS